jgi:hypothetical protein
MNILVDLSSEEQISCRTVIVIPEIALTDATYIRSFSTASPVQSKHEFYTLAQIALIQFDDDEVTPQKVAGKIIITAAEEKFELESGMLICRLESEGYLIYTNTDKSPRKYLETANRYCTRWVRLDI